MNLKKEIQKSLWKTGESATENYGSSIGNSFQKEVINLDRSIIYAPNYNGTITFSRNDAEHNDTATKPTVEVNGMIKANEIKLGTSTITKNTAKNCIEIQDGSAGKRILLKGRTLSEFSDLTSAQKSTCQVAATEGDLARLENKLAVNKENIELLIDILKLYPEMQDKMPEIEEIENMIN